MMMSYYYVILTFILINMNIIIHPLIVPMRNEIDVLIIALLMKMNMHKLKRHKNIHSEMTSIIL